MNKNVFALTLLVAVASFVPAAHGGFLCEDDDGDVEICLKRIPYTSFIPRSLPEASTAAPKLIERKVEKQAAEVEAPPPAPRATDAEVKIVETPAHVRVPDVAPVCKKYFPNLGEMLPIPCD